MLAYLTGADTDSELMVFDSEVFVRELLLDPTDCPLNFSLLP